MVDGGSWPKSMVLSQSCFDSSPKYMGSSLLASEEWIWKINFKDGSWVLEETIFGGSFLFSSRWFIFRPEATSWQWFNWSFYIVKPQQTTIIWLSAFFTRRCCWTQNPCTSSISKAHKTRDEQIKWIKCTAKTPTLHHTWSTNVAQGWPADSSIPQGCYTFYSHPGLEIARHLDRKRRSDSAVCQSLEVQNSDVFFLRLQWLWSQ